ncbi:MAG: type II toxin -antitoxin system TacA 1-like antitoxin [Acidimicrobiales bacterium]
MIEAHRDLVLSNEDFDRFLAELDKTGRPAPELAELWLLQPHHGLQHRAPGASSSRLSIIGRGRLLPLWPPLGPDRSAPAPA